MTTLVGTQTDFSDALRNLLELDYDAVEAYDAAINRLENTTYIQKLSEFRDDHKRHIQELSNLLRSHNEETPEGPSMKQWLTKGKVVLANLVGDDTILGAMKTNEEDTNTAYERMAEREDQWDDAKAIIQRGLHDERKHKRWLDDTLA